MNRTRIGKGEGTTARIRGPVGSAVRAGRLRRGMVLAGAGEAAHVGGAAETAEAVSRAGSEFTRLLHFMAVLKAGEGDVSPVGPGSLLLHRGLFAALVLLWRDPVVAAKLGATVAGRRRVLENR